MKIIRKIWQKTRPTGRSQPRLRPPEAPSRPFINLSGLCNLTLSSATTSWQRTHGTRGGDICLNSKMKLNSSSRKEGEKERRGRREEGKVGGRPAKERVWGKGTEKKEVTLLSFAYRDSCSGSFARHQASNKLAHKHERFPG